MREFLLKTITIFSVGLISISLYMLMGMYLEDKKSQKTFDEIKIIYDQDTEKEEEQNPEEVYINPGLLELHEKNPDCIGKLYMATTKARHIYTEVAYEPDSYLMFGKESAGIPEEILVKYEDYCMRIPMEYNIRSLNLSNSVAIVLYEALRQHQFAQMELQGHLHRLHWHEE